MSWTTLTRRTDLPKLSWLMVALKDAGIMCRMNGTSFHAPILEVKKSKFDEAWKLLGPIDDLSDADSMFDDPSHANAWWMKPEAAPTALVVAALGIAANKIRRGIASEVKCVPKGASTFDCPYATGVIDACPQMLWTVCKPMARLEVFGLAMASTLKVVDEEAIAMCDAIVRAMKGPELRGLTDQGSYMIAFFHVLGLWLTEGGMSKAKTLVGLGPHDLVVKVMEETVRQPDGKILPRKAVVEMQDLIGKDRLFG